MKHFLVQHIAFAGAIIAALAATSPAPAAIVQPDRVVVVVLQDRASEVLGLRYSDTNELVMPYLNGIAEDALVYSNSHGVTRFTTMNSLALFSGSLQFQSGNSYDTTVDWEPETLATALDKKGFTFSGFVESLPAGGSQVSQAGPADFPDLYTRNLNAMAMITTTTGGEPDENPDVNRTFAAFQSIATSGNYLDLPTVSFVIPNNMHNTHGTNETGTPYPSAGSDDEVGNNQLRAWADQWLSEELDGYLQWARQNNSLLIITQDEEQWTPAELEKDTVTTLVTGDPDLFEPGVNGIYMNHYNLLRTLIDMYGLDPFAEATTASPLATTVDGKLTVPEPSMALAGLAAGALFVRRNRRITREGSR